MADKKSVDPVVVEMLKKAEAEGVSTAFKRADETKPCPIGHEGNCCKHCFMGPCRLTGKTLVGICGATKSTVSARNLARGIAGGAAAHSDHGRGMALTLLAAATGEAPDYCIKDERKLRRVAGYLGVPVDGRATNDVAKDVALKALGEFGKQEGELIYVSRAPAKRQAIWRKLGVAPRGIDREIVEVLHRTSIGVDQDAEHILDHSVRCALADGWGGSMLSTDISDILFGTPGPVASGSNFGVLREDEVNVVIHGHEPTLSELIVAAANDPEILAYAKSKGAKGVNLAGICCTANEVLMRQGVPLLGNFLAQELSILTGAVDAMVVDIQDVGSRYYTFIWTMELCMGACLENEKSVVVLDRPNPLGGALPEGPVLDMSYASFVGQRPLPVRHGMTVGEIANYLKTEFYQSLDLHVVKMRGWKRKMWFDETGLPWVMPSPNMPTLDTAIVYPGMCLLEGTNLSEGRGTTRPFEIFGAPFVEADSLVGRLKDFKLPCVIFRPMYFQPTFQKHAGKLCGGAQIHVTDRNKFRPFKTGVAILKAICDLYPEQFKWKEPPYEYETEKMPIDILAGTDRLRNEIEKGSGLNMMEEWWQEELKTFLKIRRRYLLYQ